MATMDVFFHLPGVSLQGGNDFPFGKGRVSVMSFERWQQLDPSFAFAGERFARNRPVFWFAEGLPWNDSTDPKAVAQEIAHDVHMAFLLEKRAPWLPSPILSTVYLIASGIIYRLIGPMEREWVVYGSELLVPYGEHDVTAVSLLYRQLQQLSPLSRSQRVQAGLTVLERTSRPESWWGSAFMHSVNDFIHCMAGCEELLLPQEQKVSSTSKVSTAAPFSRLAATLTAPAFADIKEWTQFWSDVYQLRNKMMHGLIGLGNMDETYKRLLPTARRLLRQLIVTALALQLAGENNLAHMLHEASLDPNIHANLRHLMTEVLI